MLHQHASGDVVPIRELPYGPAAIIAASEAGQMAASDYAPNTPNTACVTRGVHRWEADMTNMVYLNSEPKEVSETCVSLGHLPNAAGEVVGQGSAPTS